MSEWRLRKMLHTNNVSSRFRAQYLFSFVRVGSARSRSFDTWTATKCSALSERVFPCNALRNIQSLAFYFCFSFYVQATGYPNHDIAFSLDNWALRKAGSAGAMSRNNGEASPLRSWRSSLQFGQRELLTPSTDEDCQHLWMGVNDFRYSFNFRTVETCVHCILQTLCSFIPRTHLYLPGCLCRNSARVSFSEPSLFLLQICYNP